MSHVSCMPRCIIPVSYTSPHVTVTSTEARLIFLVRLDYIIKDVGTQKAWPASALGERFEVV